MTVIRVSLWVHYAYKATSPHLHNAVIIIILPRYDTRYLITIFSE